MFTVRLPTVLLIVILTAAPAWADAGPDHVRVDLLADTSAVQPGRPFTVAIRFRIDPGWHIYWTNPGDSGLPTRVKLDLPPGFTAGPVQYPVPAVLRLPGGITDYGYEGRATLLQAVMPPTVLPATVRLTAHVDYLVCREDCLPGAATADLELTTSGPADPDHAAAFAASRAALPRPFEPGAGTRGPSSAIGGHGGAAVTAAFEWRDPPPGAPVWIPNTPAEWEIARPTVDTHGRTTTVRFGLSPLGHARLPQQVDGLLVSTTAAGARVAFDCPIPVSTSHVQPSTRSSP